MSDEKKVVFLAYRGPMPTASREVLSCKACTNKTWTVEYNSDGEGHPWLRCACCGENGGRIGWVHEP